MTLGKMTSGHLHHIPAGRPFADDLARGILAMVDDPRDMSDSIILLPNRRLSKALRTAFLRLADGGAQLLPRMMPIGDVDEDAGELIAAGWDADDKPPVIDGLERQLLLSRLVRKFLTGTELATLSPAEIMALARALGEFLDQIQTAGCHADDLDDLTGGDHAGHWQRILNFLHIVTKGWPQVLDERQLSDPVVWRDAAIKARAETWLKTPPKGLVVIAGSTGTIPATQILMKAVMQLPRGHLVLPALDMGMSDADWDDLTHDDLQDEVAQGVVSHPQFPLAQLLKNLGVSREEVGLWGGTADSPYDYDAEETGRLALLREAMRPANQSGQWRLIPEQQIITAQSLDGMMRVDCYDRREEAEVIALAMREALETPGKTAMLISADQRLGQMVSGELKRWGIMVSSSAGISLADTPPAHFLQLIVEAWQADFAAVPLLAMARHRLAAAGLPRSQFRQEIRQLERLVLRGKRIEGGLEGLAQKAHGISAALGQFVEDYLIKPMAPLIALKTRIGLTLADLANAHGQAAELFSQTPDEQLAPWQGQDGIRLGRFMHKLGLYGQGIEIDPASYPATLNVLMAGETLYPDHVDHPRLAILGTVEARMQSADLTILGGMNKGISPPDPPADPWMSNAMRLDFGLPHAHWRVGLASHDAVMAMARPEVLITQSIRDQGAPTEVSRWLRRLDAVLDVAQVSWPDSSRYTAMASALNQSNTVMRPCPRPEPKPPVDLRPTQFSATQLDTLLRDPYAVYAKRILNLSALPQLEEPLSPADRGNVIHDALAGYIRAHPKALPEDQAYAALIKSGKEAFAPYRNNPQVMMFWWPRYEAIAAFFAKQEKLRALDKIMSFGEIKGQMIIDINGTPHRVTARADRIDCADAGALTIIDYKTGEPPTKAQVEQGRSLQLRVEAMLAAQGGFDDLKRAFGQDSFGIDAMVYWKVSGQRSKPVEVKNVTPEDYFIESTPRGITALLMAFQEPEQGYRAEPIAREANPYSDYRHLARVAEWGSLSVDEGDGE